MKVEKYGAGVFSIHSFLSSNECCKFIEDSENATYEKATIQGIGGPRLDETIRFNDRIIVDDRSLAGCLYKQAKQHLPETIDGW